MTSQVNERCYRCLTCHKRSWYTAGTPFVRFKKLKPWLFAQWLRQKGISVTGRQLADLLMISKASGAQITRKVAFLTDKRTAESSAVQLPTALNSNNLIQFSESRLNPNHLKDERNSNEQIVSNQKQNEHARIELAIETEQARLKSENAKEKEKERENRLLSALNNEPQDFDSLLASSH